jgi:uncharacterized damage-inducible protein DinB
MSSEHAVARSTLEAARLTFTSNVEGIALDEALDTAGGFRSIMGLIKHTAGWTAVYRSFAFDAVPRSWKEIDWPGGLRERLEPSVDYLQELLAWFDTVSTDWLAALRDDIDLDESRPVHWGETWPIRDIIAYVAAHWAYHAGEINLILAVRRNEAWEYGEHVEENHISTIGHSVRRPWITDEYVDQVEAEMRQAAQPSDS